MGQFSTKPTEDDPNLTPKQPFKLPSDPRSPTFEYSRTPIIVDRISKRGVSSADSAETRTVTREEIPLDLSDGDELFQKPDSEFIEDEDDEAPSVLDDGRRREIFTELISLLKPELTISRALADIKKKKNLSAAQEIMLRRRKKAGKGIEQTDDEKDTAKLDALADELISAGHMDAYEWTRERIEQMLKKMDNTATDSLDMFSNETTTGSSNAAADTTDDEVKWEYKENDTAEITGPFTSAEMAARQEKDELGPKGLARKIGSG